MSREWGKNDNQSNKQSINQPTNQSTIQLNVNILQQILTFQQAFSNFSILIPSVSQVYRNFPIMLFYSFVVKFNILCNNFSIMVISYIQVFINFSVQYCFDNEIQYSLQQLQYSHYKSYLKMSTFNIVLFHYLLRKSNTFLQQLISILF